MKKLLAILLLTLLPAQALALGYYSDALQDEQGNGMAALNVTVYLADTGTLARIYSDNGITEIGNPVTTDYIGRFGFWVVNGLYDLCVTGTGVTPWCLENVKVLDEGHVGLPSFNVTDSRFGAVSGDDLDDSAAFQACLDALEAVGGGTMVVPSGGVFDIYSVVNLPSNITITGGGKLVNHVTGASNRYSFMFRAEGEDNIVIEGLEIDGNASLSAYNGTAYPGVLYFSGVDGLTVRDCEIYDSASDGILVGEYNGSDTKYGPCSSVSITGNLIRNARRDGVVVSAGDGIVIANNRIVDHWGVAIDVEPYYSTIVGSTGGPRTVSGVTITGNWCYTSRDGVWTGWEPYTVSRSLDVSCQDWDDGVSINSITITGNHFESYTATPDPDATFYPREVLLDYASNADADSLFGGSLIFSGNVVKTNRITTANASFGVVNVRTNVSLTMIGNSIEGPWEPNTAGDWGINRAISLSGDAGTLRAPVISGNTIRGYFQIGIHMQGVYDAVLNGNNLYLEQDDAGTSTATYGLRLYDVDGVTVTGGSIHTAGYPLYISGASGLEENNITLTGVNLHSRRLFYITRIESNAVVNGLHFTGCTVNNIWGPKGGRDIIRTYVLAGGVLNQYSDRGTNLEDGGSEAAGTKQIAIDARDYGANGGDTLDDTAAIQAAIDAAEANGGCYVDLPSGNFYVSALTIEADGVILRGAGTGYEYTTTDGTVIRPALTGGGSFLLTVGAGGRNTYRSGATGIKFHWGSGTGSLCQSLVQMVNCQSGLIRDCVFYLNAAYNPYMYCLLIDTAADGRSSNNVIDNCLFSAPKYYPSGDSYGFGVSILNSGFMATGYNSSNHFTNCKFYNPAVTGSGAIIQIGTASGTHSFVNCQVDLANGSTFNGILVGGTGANSFVNVVIDSDGIETGLRFSDMSGAGTVPNFFMGAIDAAWEDLNDSPDDMATVIDYDDDRGGAYRALSLIPRSAAPGVPTEGTYYYDSDTDDVMIYTSEGWEIWFDGSD